MKSILLLTIFSLTLMNIASAESSKTLEEFIGQELELAQNALSESSQRPTQTNEEWQMSRIRLRIRAKGGIDIPKLLKFEVRPYVEFYWNKK